MASIEAAQSISDLDQSSPEARLDGAERKPGLLGDFGVGHSLVKVEGENLLGFLRKLFERCADIFAFAGDGGRGFDRSVVEGLAFGKWFKLGTAALFAREVNRPSSGQHADEGAFGRDRRIVALGGFPKVGEGFLNDVFRG